MTNNDVDENFSDRSIKEHPTGNDQQNLLLILLKTQHSDVNATPTTTNTSVVVQSVSPLPSTFTAASDSATDDVEENLSDMPIKERPNGNNQQKLLFLLLKKHHSDVYATPTTTNASVVVESVSSSLTVASDSTTDDFDKNLSYNSIEEKSSQNKQSTTNPPIKQKKKSPKRHTCKKCNRSFNRPGKLEFHKKVIHKGIRDHVCDECGKRYITLNHLQTHARTHTGKH